MQIRLITSIITLFFITSCIKGKKVDFIFHNTLINSCDESAHVFEAIAISNGEIVELGPERQILNKYRSEKSEDLKSKFVYPTFIDANFKLFDILHERFSIQTNQVDNEKHLVYLIEKKLEKSETPIISINNSTFNKKSIFYLLNQKFPSKRVYFEIKDSLFFTENKTIKSLNDSEKRIFKSNLLKNNLAEFKSLYLEIQNELIEHGYKDILVHNCNKDEFDFLNKIKKYLTIEIKLYTNYIEKRRPSNQLYLNGFYIEESNKTLLSKFVENNMPISFTSSFFQTNYNLLKNQIIKINQDHRWTCIINSELSATESEHLNMLNIYPIVNSTSNEIEKNNFLSCFGSGNTKTYDMELKMIKDLKTSKNQKHKLLFSNGHKLTFNENNLGSLEKKKIANIITIDTELNNINSIEQLYIGRMYIKNKLFYQVD
jgi:hypothetical protein